MLFLVKVRHYSGALVIRTGVVPGGVHEDFHYLKKKSVKIHDNTFVATLKGSTSCTNTPLKKDMQINVRIDSIARS